MKPTNNPEPFISDIKTLRARARENIGTGNVTFTYEGDVNKTIEICSPSSPPRSSAYCGTRCMQ